MRWIATVVLVVLMAVAPASAGTPADPEIADPCGSPTNAGMEPLAPWEDICAVWFGTAAGDGGLIINVRTGSLSPRAPSIRAVNWSSGGCSLVAVHEDASGPDQVANHALYIQCSEARETPCPVPTGIQACYTNDDPVRVPLDGSVVETAGTVTFTISPQQVPANLRGLLGVGSRVQDPMAWAGPMVAGQTLNAGAPCQELTCASKVGDATSKGRSFTIGG